MRTMLLLLATLALLSPVRASHCTTWSTSETSVEGDMVVVPIDVGSTRLYFYADLCQEIDPEGSFIPGHGPFIVSGCLFSNWFYEESNGLPGLQRGDDVVDNTCHGLIESDTFVF